MPQHNSPSRKSSVPQLTVPKNRAGWVGVSLTALGMLIAGILYITTSIASTKAWAAEEDKATRISIDTKLKSNYVDKVQYTKDITILGERQQTIKKNVVDIKEMLKEMYEDIRANRNVRNRRSYARDDDTK